MKNDNKKKLSFLFVFIIVFLLTFITIQYHAIKFDFVTKTIEVGHNDYQIKAKSFKRDISNYINIINNIDSNRVGNYEVEVSYKVFLNFRKKETTYVRVIDSIPPTLDLVGDNTIYLDIDSEYKELGYNVSDNFDKSVNVIITNNVNINEIGVYVVEYKAVDSSNNITIKNRTVIVE